ncbi:MAG: FAD-dependent oxidoreductase [Acutalibacteraceae bacterium]
MKESFDILIVGAGASGLAAAISAKRALPRLRVAMLERLPRVGKKNTRHGKRQMQSDESQRPVARLHQPRICRFGVREIRRAAGSAIFLKASGF